MHGDAPIVVHHVTTHKQTNRAATSLYYDETMIPDDNRRRSKWIDTNITSGYPYVSDNVTGFFSEEFRKLSRQNHIKHITNEPHQPATNGLTEQAVGVAKEGVKRMQRNDLETKLSHFIFDYRITQHSKTGIIPSELLMKRQLKTRLCIIPHQDRYR